MKQQKFNENCGQKKSTTAHRQWCDKSIKNINAYYHLSQPNPNQIKNHKNKNTPFTSSNILYFKK